MRDALDRVAQIFVLACCLRPTPRCRRPICDHAAGHDRVQRLRLIQAARPTRRGNSLASNIPGSRVARLELGRLRPVDPSDMFGTSCWFFNHRSYCVHEPPMLRLCLPRQPSRACFRSASVDAFRDCGLKLADGFALAGFIPAVVGEARSGTRADPRTDVSAPAVGAQLPEERDRCAAPGHQRFVDACWSSSVERRELLML